MDDTVRDAPASRTRVFTAISLDGYIAGEDDDLSWLPPPPAVPTPGGDPDYGYGAFMAQIGALLMGRRTYDVVAGFEGPWPYGDRPVLVVTRRPIAPVATTVVAVTGELSSLVARAKEAAAGRDVYVDGGELIRQLLDAGCIDLITVTIIPVVLGRGIPLFAGAARRHSLELRHCESMGPGLIQLTYETIRS